jgi:hypothetical protein
MTEEQRTESARHMARVRTTACRPQRGRRLGRRRRRARDPHGAAEPDRGERRFGAAAARRGAQ